MGHPSRISPRSARTNFAAAASGATAVASSELGPASSAIDGSLIWATGQPRKDDSPSAYPDWVQVNFGSDRSIDEINVFGVMDDFESSAPPTTDLTVLIMG